MVGAYVDSRPVGLLLQRSVVSPLAALSSAAAVASSIVVPVKNDQ